VAQDKIDEKSIYINISPKIAHSSVFTKLNEPSTR